MTQPTISGGASALPVSLFHAPAGPATMLRGPMIPRAPEGAEGGSGGDGGDAGGALSIEDAVGALDALAPEDEDNELEAGAQPAEDADAPGDDLAGEGEGEDGDEPGADEGSPAEAPHFWAAEDKELFAQLPPALQEVIVKHDGARERAVSQAIEQTATVRKQLSSSAQEVQSVRDRLATALPEAEGMFAARWAQEDGSPPDWLAIANEFGNEVAQTLKEQHAADVAALEKIRGAAKEAETVALEEHKRTTVEELAKTAPDLIDPARGAERRTKLSSFLRAEGYSGDELNWASARDFRIAYDAMQWRELQASLAKGGKGDAPKPAPKNGPTARPSAPPEVRGAQKRQAISRRDRFQKTGSIDDAVAYLDARN